MLRKRSIVVALTTTLVALALTPVPMTTADGQTTGGSATDPVRIALDHVTDNAADLGVARNDVADLAVASSYTSAHNRVTHVNLNQRHRGLEILGAYATINVAEGGEVLFAGDSLIKGLSVAIPAATELDALDAVTIAAKELELEDPESLRVVSAPQGRAQETVVSKAGISDQPIPARLETRPTHSEPIARTGIRRPVGARAVFG